MKADFTTNPPYRYSGTPWHSLAWTLWATLVHLNSKIQNSWCEVVLHAQTKRQSELNIFIAKVSTAWYGLWGGNCFTILSPDAGVVIPSFHSLSLSLLARKATSMCEGSASYPHVSCHGSPQWKDEKKLHSHQQMWSNIIGLPAWISQETSLAIQLQLQSAEQQCLGLRVAVVTLAQERRAQVREQCLEKIEERLFIKLDLCLNFNCRPCVLLVRQGDSSSLWSIWNCRHE